MPNIYHIFNRANDRETLFLEDQNYEVFLQKMQKSILPVAHILGYCIMPNHFHLVVVTKTKERTDLVWTDKPSRVMPTYELSTAMRSWLMGFTRAYNKFYKLTGSRWQQHSQVTHHGGQLTTLLEYVHRNPVKAGLVTDALDWWYSSAAEYAGMIPEADCICDLQMGRGLL